jgi:hypothetical protein
MRVIALLCLLLMCSSCGVDPQSSAHVFDRSEVPYGLTDTTPPSTAGTVEASPFSSATAPVEFDLYFIRSGILAAVTRRAAVAPLPSELVAILVAGPTPAERDTGHRSALTGLEITARAGDAAATVNVDLARTFNDIPRSDRILALGQITLTLTARAGVSVVQYTIDGAPIEVPKANGVVTRDPVSRADYLALLQGPGAVPSTTTPPATATTR